MIPGMPSQGGRACTQGPRGQIGLAHFPRQEGEPDALERGVPAGPGVVGEEPDPVQGNGHRRFGHGWTGLLEPPLGRLEGRSHHDGRLVTQVGGSAGTPQLLQQVGAGHGGVLHRPRHRTRR